MSKGSNKKLKLKLTDNKCLQKLNEKKNCGKDNESFILNKDLDDPNWKFSHILSKRNFFLNFISYFIINFSWAFKYYT